MNYTALIVTPFAQDSDGSWCPKVMLDHALLGFEDQTGQQPISSPNAYTIRATLTDTVLDAVEADANYLVLSAEPIVEVEL